MRVKITVTKVNDYKTRNVRTYAVAQDMYVEGDNLEFRAKGTLLEVFDKNNKVSYTTDLLYSSAITALDAAQTAGLQWVLT